MSMFIVMSTLADSRSRSHELSLPNASITQNRLRQRDTYIPEGMVVILHTGTLFTLRDLRFMIL
jgi:hypothetical protein